MEIMMMELRKVISKTLFVVVCVKLAGNYHLFFRKVKLYPERHFGYVLVR